MVLLIIGFFNPAKSLFWYKGEPTKAKSFIVYFGLFLVLGYTYGEFLPDSGDNRYASYSESNQTTTNNYSTEGQDWQMVYEVKGNGAKKSAPFALNGKNSRIKYYYDTNSKDNIGTFNVYVVEVGHEVLKDGGFPEIMIDQGEVGESYLYKSKGRYYLDVMASGSWTIQIEEMK